MTHGLMARIGKRGRPDCDTHDWESRDYALPVIPCEMITCPVNRARKCSMPSAMRIGADGGCKTGAEFKAKPAIAPERVKPRCKHCGAEIRQGTNALGQVTWDHIDEKFRHQAEPR